MRTTIIASTALLAGSALAQGNAYVVNNCGYDVYMSNTPASGGGFSEIDKVLPGNGGKYSQQWTQLSNGFGWSMKLAKTDSYQTNVMQYEYTYLGNGIIWYDLSEVDGNPWDGDWDISATGDCDPKQAAYQYSTDDANGMQASCPDSSDITVTLCSSFGSTNGSPGGSYSAGSSAASSTEAPSSTQAPSSQTSAPSSTHKQSHGGRSHTWAGVADKQAAPVTPSPSPTTMVTRVAAGNGDGGFYDVTVTDWATEVVTAMVTAAAPKPKRHEHHPRHPHERRQE